MMPHERKEAFPSLPRVTCWRVSAMRCTQTTPCSARRRTLNRTPEGVDHHQGQAMWLHGSLLST